MNDLRRGAPPLIRPMRVAELDEVARLEGLIYPFPWTLGNFKDSLGAGYSCWVLLNAEHIAGYCVVMVGVEELHLLNLSVAPDWQRQGLGTQLLRHLIDEARSYAAKRFLLEVRESNATARKFYEFFGFQSIGVRRDYYPVVDGREDAIVMELNL